MREDKKVQVLPQLLFTLNQHRDFFFKFAIETPEYYVLVKTMLNEAANEFNPNSSLTAKIDELEACIADLQEKIYFQPGGAFATETKLDFEQKNPQK